MRNIDELTGFEGLKNSIQAFAQELWRKKQTNSIQFSPQDCILRVLQGDPNYSLLGSL